MRKTLSIILISFIITCSSLTTTHNHPTRLKQSAKGINSVSLPTFQKTRHCQHKMSELSSTTTTMATGNDEDHVVGVPTKIGFIGCGTIAVAIATGIATQSKIPVESIVVSKRSEQKSKRLAETFPDLVRIQEDNQKILDESDLIFLCVLPEIASEVLQNLSFDKDRHTLVSLVVSVFLLIWLVIWCGDLRLSRLMQACYNSDHFRCLLLHLYLFSESVYCEIGRSDERVKVGCHQSFQNDLSPIHCSTSRHQFTLLSH